MEIHEEYHKWHSPMIGREFEMLVFGHAGTPVILFPTSKGTYYQHKDMGMITAAAGILAAGKARIYCPDSLDAYTWYDDRITPAQRAYNHTLYDRLILDEVSTRARQETGKDRIAVAGCSFGGYHAANFAFRHPHMTGYCFSMSGIFDIKSFVNGYYDDNVYFNNPADYLPEADDPYLWKMDIILGTADADICREDNERLSGILTRKNIGHWLDIRPERNHDWPVWREMFPYYLSLLH